MTTYRMLSIPAALAAIFCLLSPIALSGYSQTKQAEQGQDSVKLRGELVLIDVLVTDRNNRPVPGLKREDFQVFDNGKAQPITTFAYEDTKPKRTEGVSTETATLPRAITSGDLKRVVAFVVDALHMKHQNLYRTRDVLKNFIDNSMQPGDLVVIVSTGGGSGLLQQFTSDKRVLHRAADRLRPLYYTSMITPYRTLDNRNPGLTREPLQNRRLPGAPPTMIPSTGVARTSGFYDPLERADVRATLQTLNNLIKWMAKLPGRKLGVFISEGLRIFETDTAPELRDTGARAARANVAFYSIDPRGLDAWLPLPSEAPSSIFDAPGTLAERNLAEVEQNRSDVTQSQASLRELAAETGGKFFANTNDFKRGFEGLLEENSAYYMLGFQPEAKNWDDKFHKIKVAVRDRPDLSVSARRGYQATSEKPGRTDVNPRVAEAIEAINSPLVRRDVDLRVTPIFLDDTEGDAILTTLLHIDTSKLNFKQVEGKYHTELEQVGYLFDSSGRVADQFTDTVKIDLAPDSYELALKRGFVSTRRVKVKPGLYQSRLFIREEGSGLIGTANDIVEIPNLKDGRFALSSIVVRGGGDEKSNAAQPATEGPTLSMRRFSRTSALYYHIVIYNATGGQKNQPELEMQTRVLKGNQVVYTGPPKSVQIAPGSELPARIITGGALQLQSLTADEYVIEIAVRDKLRKKEAVARQQIDFTVE